MQQPTLDAGRSDTSHQEVLPPHLREVAARLDKPPSPAEVTQLERWMLQRLLHRVGDPPLIIRLWNGEEFRPPDGKPIGSLTFTQRAALWKLIPDPNYQFGEIYSDGSLQVDGKLDEVMTVIFDAFAAAKPAGSLREGLVRWAQRPRRNSLHGSRQNIHHHYDIGNAFYRLWLDEQLLYTCAYFPHPEASIEEAQIAKMHHVCRKLQLRPGMSVIEAGCGWGALAMHMARHYGVRVKAYNISHEQIVLARARAKEKGVDDRVEFIEDDWRNIHASCDAFVSVGMLEHVGRQHYRQLSDVIDRCLTKNGRGLIHTIGQNRPLRFSPWIERRIFPGAYPPTLAEMMDIFAPNDFSVLDVENLRLHYAQTLRHWLARFEENVGTIRDMFDERFVRMWRLYLAGSVAAFATSTYQLYQVVFARAGDNEIPWTREHLYHNGDSACNSNGKSAG